MAILFPYYVLTKQLSYFAYFAYSAYYNTGMLLFFLDWIALPGFELSSDEDKPPLQTLQPDDLPPLQPVDWHYMPIGCGFEPISAFFIVLGQMHGNIFSIIN